MPHEPHLSRRGFIQRFGLAGLAGVSAIGLGSGCGSEQEQQGQTTGDPCADLSGLTENEIKQREAVSYQKKTPYPDNRCDNCQFWIPPKGDSPCGECVVVPGPIHPPGYCTSWAPQSKSS